MRAAVVTRKGGPEVLEIRELPEPEPGPGQVRVRVKAIGLNFADVLMRLGVYTGTPAAPFVPGLEFSGVIEKVGDGVDAFRGGEPVMAVTRCGSHAELVVLDALRAMRLPAQMSFEEGAAFPVNYLSAHCGLVHLGRICAGERLLLHAAAGGVGIAAIQLARHIGAEIFGTAGSAAKVELIRSMGVEHPINYRVDDFAAVVRRLAGQSGIDVVMDSVAGRLFKPGWDLLAPMGRYIIYGMASVSGTGGLNYLRAAREWLALPRIRPLDMVAANRTLAGFHLGTLDPSHAYFRSASGEIAGLYERGILRPFVGATFPFERIREAHDHLQSRASTGKVVVTVR
jgi:NADPH:quinone reductase-like Zn-dependent oxidoreductase